jgi:threonine dehydratase
MTVSIKEISQAASLLSGSINKTPCVPSKTLSEITGANVILKFENHQFTASFKDRGALVKLLSLSSKEKKAGVIALSAGNHAQAVAYHAKRLGIPATIVMPRHTPNVKVERTRAFAVEVLLHGDSLTEAGKRMAELAKSRRLTPIHPYDDEKIIAGQGTIALEMLDAFPDLECILVPIGGGGLIAGVAVAAKALCPSIQIVGIETAHFPSMQQALKGKPIQCQTSTIAEGIGVSEPGRLTLPIVRHLVEEIILVSENQIEEAILLFLEVEKTIVEGAGAVGLAALLKNKKQFANRKVGIILSGGNIDLLILSSIIQRGLVRSGRLARFRIGIPDVPGALAEITKLLGLANANIVEIRHQRAFTSLSLRLAEVQFVVQTRGKEHVKQIETILKDADYKIYPSDQEFNET